MSLWGNLDAANNAPKIGDTMGYGGSAPQVTSNTQVYYANTKLGSFITNAAIGVFGVSAAEQTLSATSTGGAGHPQHAGWVIRHEGTGLKAGRVWYETLVAMGSMSGDDEDTLFPDYGIVIGTQPSSNTSATAGNLTFTVVATSVPTGATLSYKWQRYNSGWIDVANTAGRYFNNTSPTFTANNVTANGNVFRVMVMTNGGTPTVYSANATISKV